MNNAAGRVRQWDKALARKTKPSELKTATVDGKLRGTKGRFHKGHQGAKAFAETERIGAAQFVERMKRDGVEVVEIIEYKKRVRVDGVNHRREYDRIVRMDDGTWAGLEVKSGNATRDRKQTVFDKVVTPENPARVTLNDGREIEIVHVFLERVPGL